MNRNACIYRLDHNNNMRFVCSGKTIEKAEEFLMANYNPSGKSVNINWTEIQSTDWRGGAGMWHGVIKNEN